MLKNEDESKVYGEEEYNKWMTGSLGRPVPIVEWGMDSLAVQAKHMTPNYRQEYFPSDENLRFYSASGELLFEEMNVESYSGNDGKSFDERRRELSKLMVAYPLELSNMLIRSDAIPAYNSGYPKRLYVSGEGERRLIHGKGTFHSIKIRDDETGEYALGHENDGEITATYNWLSVEATIDKNAMTIEVAPNNTDKIRHLTIEGNLGNDKVVVTIYQAAH